jgi:hypothetical protein
VASARSSHACWHCCFVARPAAPESTILACQDRAAAASDGSRAGYPRWFRADPLARQLASTADEALRITALWGRRRRGRDPQALSTAGMEHADQLRARHRQGVAPAHRHRSRRRRLSRPQAKEHAGRDRRPYRRAYGVGGTVRIGLDVIGGIAALL